MIRFYCDCCKKYKVEEKYIGKVIKCTDCGLNVKVPSESIPKKPQLSQNIQENIKIPEVQKSEIDSLGGTEEQLKQEMKNALGNFVSTAKHFFRKENRAKFTRVAKRKISNPDKKSWMKVAIVAIFAVGIVYFMFFSEGKEDAARRLLGEADKMFEQSQKMFGKDDLESERWDLLIKAEKNLKILRESYGDTETVLSLKYDILKGEINAYIQQIKSTRQLRNYWRKE